MVKFFGGKNKFILIVAAVVIAAVLIIVAVMRRSSPVVPGQPAASPSAPTVASETRSPAPTNVSVPELNSTNTPQNVAVPQVVQPANSQTQNDIRVFNVSVNNNQFSPDTIIAKLGDNITIKFTAVDKNYDFTQPDYGYNGVVLPKGQTKSIPFQVTAAGKFTFYCSSCGGPKSGPVGYLIVAAR